MTQKAKKTVLPAFFAMFFIVPLTAAADGTPAIQVTPAPGLYASAITVTANVRSGNTQSGDTLLFVSVNGSDFIPSSGTVLCPGKEGEETEYTITFWICPPGSKTIVAERSVDYTIDRKPPAEPGYSSKAVESGTEYTFTLNEPGEVLFSIHDPLAGSTGSGSAEGKGTVFVPDGASAVAFGVDRAGNRGPAVNLISHKPEAEQGFIILNPVSGVWNNMQTLVIEAPASMELYYSSISVNPLESGFAYDGPVLLEQTGTIQLSVVGISESGLVFEQMIEYTAAPVPAVFPPEVTNIDPLISGDSSGQLSIPQEMLYCLGEETEPYIPGRTLQLDGLTGKSRCLPLTVADNGRFYRVVLNLKGQDEHTSGLPEPSAARIRVHDWVFAELTGAETIYYTLNGDIWRRYLYPVVLDRSVNNVLQWRRDIPGDDTINFFRFPAKPPLIASFADSVTPGSIQLNIDNPVFEFRYEQGFRGVPEPPGPVSSPVKTPLLFDTVYGDMLESHVRIGVWYEGVEQGELSAEIVIDKRPPRAPVIRASASERYTRAPVTISCEGEGEVYAAIRKHTAFWKDGRWSVPGAEFSDSDFNPVSAPFLIDGDEMSAAAYTIRAYSVDDAGNQGLPAEYSVIIDRNNFYVTSGAASGGDGSPSRPFSSLEEALSLALHRETTRIYAEGVFDVADCPDIISGVTITGVKNPLFKFGPETVLNIRKGGSLSLNGCIIEQDLPQSQIPPQTAEGLLQRPLIYVSGGGLLLSDSAVSVRGGFSRSLCTAVNSAVNISGSSLSLKAENYGVLISSEGGTVSIAGTDSAVSAPAASGYSVTRGSFEMTGSSCTVSAGMGRILESYQGGIILRGNTFTAEGEAPQAQAVWADSRSTVLKTEDNRVTGFILP